MSTSSYNEHYECTCSYVDFLKAVHPDKKVSGVLLHFTTDRQQCDHFAQNERPDIALLNVHMWLDDPSNNVFYAFTPPVPIPSLGAVDAVG